MAFCLAVCFCAGLLGSSLRRLDRQELGFRPERIMLLEAFAAQPHLQPGTWRQLASRLAELPGVEKVGLSGWPVQTGGANIGKIQVGNGPVEIQGPYTFHADADWFGVMGIPLVEGRMFRPEDTWSVAIVNQQFARHYYGGRSAVGESILVWDKKVEIIGVAGGIRMRDVREAVRPAVFSVNGGRLEAAVTMRLSPGASAAALAGPVRRLMADQFPGLRLDNIRMQEDLIRAQTVRERLVAALSGFFGAVALALAGIGLYGVLAHAVARRTREIAVRMALGARAMRVAARVVRELMGPLVAGTAAGFAAGRAAEAGLRGFLFEASASDAAVIVPVLEALAVTGVLAAAVPVGRAVRIDPARALRMD